MTLRASYIHEYTACMTKKKIPEGVLPLESEDFRSFLQNELVRRTRVNPKYSVRAFAGFLGIANSSLAKILSGSRVLTPKMIRRLGAHFELSPERLEKFCLKISKKNNVSTGSKPVSLERISYTQLASDQFALISEWYHYGILELLQLSSSRGDNRWLADQLGISIAEVHQAVERLQRLNLIRLDVSGRWQRNVGAIYTGSFDHSTSALRKAQRESLELSMKALETISMKLRDHSSLTLAISTSKIKEAKDLIDEFKDKMVHLLMKDKSSLDCVYQLQISLFPITKMEKR